MRLLGLVAWGLLVAARQADACSLPCSKGRFAPGDGTSVPVSAPAFAFRIPYPPWGGNPGVLALRTDGGAAVPITVLERSFCE